MLRGDRAGPMGMGPMRMPMRMGPMGMPNMRQMNNPMGMNSMGMNQMGMNSMGMNQMGMYPMGMNMMDMSQMGMGQIGANQMRMGPANNFVGMNPGMGAATGPNNAGTASQTVIPEANGQAAPEKKVKNANYIIYNHAVISEREFLTSQIKFIENHLQQMKERLLSLKETEKQEEK